MRAPAIIRLLMVVVAMGVVLVVGVSWRSRPDDITATESDGPAIGAEVVSRTDSPHYVSVVNGVTRYEVYAGRAVSFEGNRIEYDGGVKLILYGEPAAETGIQERTVVRAERLVAIERDVPVEGDAYESVRLLDRADSLVIASTLDPALPGRLRAFRPVGVGELRAAIDGPMIVVDRFRRTLREADEAAIDFMLSELSNGSWHSGMRQVVSAGVLRGASRVGGLIDRWSSAP